MHANPFWVAFYRQYCGWERVNEIINVVLSELACARQWICRPPQRMNRWGRCDTAARWVGACTMWCTVFEVCRVSHKNRTFQQEPKDKRNVVTRSCDERAMTTAATVDTLTLELKSRSSIRNYVQYSDWSLKILPWDDRWYPVISYFRPPLPPL